MESVYVNKAANLLSKGHTYEKIQIDPDEFARDCDSHGEQRTLQGLDKFRHSESRRSAKPIAPKRFSGLVCCGLDKEGQVLSSIGKCIHQG
jgi:hypothetical protein